MQQPWFDHYPVGIPHTIDEEEYGSLSELFEDGFKKYSELPAFENMGKVITYKELNELSMAFASYLTNVAGAKKGGPFGYSDAQPFAISGGHVWCSEGRYRSSKY